MAYKALLPNWKIPLVHTKIYESIQKTADMLEEPVSQIRQIYDIIEKLTGLRRRDHIQTAL